MNRFAIVALLVSSIFSGCALKAPPYDYDPNFDTSRLETFTLRTDPNMRPDPINDERVRAAVEDTLFKKGYSEASDLGDFTVLYGLEILKNRPSPVTFGIGIGGISGNIAGSISTAITPKQDEILLSLKMVDPKTKRVFWSAKATKGWSNLTPKQKSEVIEKEIGKLLSHFPKKGSPLTRSDK